MANGYIETYCVVYMNVIKSHKKLANAETPTLCRNTYPCMYICICKKVYK